MQPGTILAVTATTAGTRVFRAMGNRLWTQGTPNVAEFRRKLMSVCRWGAVDLAADSSLSALADGILRFVTEIEKGPKLPCGLHPMPIRPLIG